MPGFVIQGGDPNTKDNTTRSKWGTGGPGWNIKADFNKKKHSRGVLSMARSQAPDSRLTILYSAKRLKLLRWEIYSIWKGNTWNGLDIVDRIASLKTDSANAPVDIDESKIIKVIVSE